MVVWAKKDTEDEPVKVSLMVTPAQSAVAQVELVNHLPWYWIYMKKSEYRKKKYI